VWVPGYYAFDGSSTLDRGRWECRRQYHYFVRAHWAYRGGNYVYIRGYWR